MQDTDQYYSFSLFMERFSSIYPFPVSSLRRASFFYRLNALQKKHGETSLTSLLYRADRNDHIKNDIYETVSIGTKDMFRDPFFFRKLRKLLTSIYQKKNNLRVWVPFASSGSEAHSFAILFAEEKLSASQLFASELNPYLFQKATTGLYYGREMSEAESSYLKSGGCGNFSSFYRKDYSNRYSNLSNTLIYDHVRLDNSFLKMIQWENRKDYSPHPVLYNMDFISCRNVLIYLHGTEQRNILIYMIQALNDDGYLALGYKDPPIPSEFANELRVVDREERIYQKSSGGRSG